MGAGVFFGIMSFILLACLVGFVLVWKLKPEWMFIDWAEAGGCEDFCAGLEPANVNCKTCFGIAGSGTCEAPICDIYTGKTSCEMVEGCNWNTEECTEDELKRRAILLNHPCTEGGWDDLNTTLCDSTEDDTKAETQLSDEISESSISITGEDGVSREYQLSENVSYPELNINKSLGEITGEEAVLIYQNTCDPLSTGYGLSYCESKSSDTGCTTNEDGSGCTSDSSPWCEFKLSTEFKDVGRCNYNGTDFNTCPSSWWLDHEAETWANATVDRLNALDSLTEEEAQELAAAQAFI